MHREAHPVGAHEAAGELEQNHSYCAQRSQSGCCRSSKNGSPGDCECGCTDCDSALIAQPALAVPPESDTAGAIRYFARQPILNPHGKIFGYELLFRSGREADFRGDPNAATRSILDQSVTHGVDALANGRMAFVNCTREAILEEQVRVLPQGKTVLELLETLEPDEELLAGCSRLHRAGYRFALDDFTWSDSWASFLHLVDYIKVDIEQTDMTERMALMQNLRLHHCAARLIAERVETEEQFQQLRREGFELFQGYFFARPAIVENRTIPTNRLLHLDLLRALLEEPLDQNKLSELVKRDPALMLRLFRLVNSPLYGVRNEIHSIRIALQLVGDAVFRRMATLAVASEMVGGRPSELLLLAFHRARFCELVAEHRGLDATEQYVLGILSLVPALLNVSVESLVSHLPLSRPIQHALLGAENPERGTLNWLESYEHGKWVRSDELAGSFGLTPEILAKLYIESSQWARENMPCEESES